MSFNYEMVKYLFGKAKDSGNALKLDYDTGHFFLIESDFTISNFEKEYYNSNYLIVEGYEYYLAEKNLYLLLLI